MIRWRLFTVDTYSELPAKRVSNVRPCNTLEVLAISPDLPTLRDGHRRNRQSRLSHKAISLCERERMVHCNAVLLKGFETAWKSGHVKLDRVGGAAATTTDRTAILKQLVISVRIDKSCSINTFHPKQRIGY